MRLLTRSKQPKSSILAQVTGGPFLPGDQVDVELIWPVGLPGWPEGGPKYVALDLVCRETFWYTVKSTGAAFIGQYPGRGEENHTGMPYTAAGRPGRFKTSKDLATLSSNVPLTNKNTSLSDLRGIAKFQLPADAPPNIEGKTARVDWELRVRSTSGASQESTPVGKITVLSKPVGNVGNQAGRHESDVRSEAPREFNIAHCDMYLSLPEGALFTGQTLHGALSARALKDINVTKIQAELDCLEQAGAKQSSAVYTTVILQGRSLLQAGQDYQWPFQLRIPNCLLPSVSLDETSVVWRVKGILGRTFRTRLETAKQVQVLTVA